jgi:hypothetical protein
MADHFYSTNIYKHHIYKFLGSFTEAEAAKEPDGHYRRFRFYIKEVQRPSRRWASLTMMMKQIE